jgi:putative Holliday junction resolvase
VETAREAALAGKALGIDLGSRRIGIAVSDGARSLAFPRPCVKRRAERRFDHEVIARIAQEEGADVVVVGLPLSLDGRHGPAAAAAAEEARALAALLTPRGVRVETFDERLTTVSAHAALSASGTRGPKRRARVDSAAAAVLLQAWLDAR